MVLSNVDIATHRETELTFAQKLSQFITLMCKALARHHIRTRLLVEPIPDDHDIEATLSKTLNRYDEEVALEPKAKNLTKMPKTFKNRALHNEQVHKCLCLSLMNIHRLAMECMERITWFNPNGKTFYEMVYLALIPLILDAQHSQILYALFQETDHFDMIFRHKMSQEVMDIVNSNFSEQARSRPESLPILSKNAAPFAMGDFTMITELPLPSGMCSTCGIDTFILEGTPKSEPHLAICKTVFLAELAQRGSLEYARTMADQVG